MKIAYWIVTGLFSVAFLMSGIMNLSGAEEIVKNYTDLGYPLYLPKIIGTAKVLGALAVLLPPAPDRLKVAAYTGFGILCVGGITSHLFSGDPVTKTLPLVFLGLLGVASYVLYAKNRDG